LNDSVTGCIACPNCKGALGRSQDNLTCTSCSESYSVVNGIPQLFSKADRLTIDPAHLAIKTRERAFQTVADMKRIDCGLVSKPRVYYLLYVLLVLCFITPFWTGALLILALLVVDWLVFRTRRGQMLERFLENPLRLRTLADYGAVDELYRREGREQPNMSDWVRLSQEEGGGEAEESPVQDDERYRDILDVYRKVQPSPSTVVDVGANDGHAYTEFGIGEGTEFIGIDVSRLLLETFLDRVADQTALQADGLCLPLRDDSVDFLFCTETLEHIADPDAAIGEFVRVLKPGGRFMVQSPNAHRLRNLNIVHITTLLVSLAADSVLQKKIVHENTWHNGITYHWDFSVQDYRRMASRHGARVIELRSRAFFWPEFLIRGNPERFRAKERALAAIPLLRFLGGDLVLVAEKPAQ
jgi:SAM-dependent methyltransferase/uncharacterized protein YbaR (Trm112 family)